MVTSICVAPEINGQLALLCDEAHGFHGHVPVHESRACASRAVALLTPCQFRHRPPTGSPRSGRKACKAAASVGFTSFKQASTSMLLACNRVKIVRHELLLWG